MRDSASWNVEQVKVYVKERLRDRYQRLRKQDAIVVVHCSVLFPPRDTYTVRDWRERSGRDSNLASVEDKIRASFAPISGLMM